MTAADLQRIIAAEAVDLGRRRALARSIDTMANVTADRIEGAGGPVDRDPCPRCGVRRDIGCGHTAMRLVAGYAGPGGRL